MADFVFREPFLLKPVLSPYLPAFVVTVTPLKIGDSIFKGKVIENAPQLGNANRR